MTLQLIPTWRRAWTWLSVQAAVLLVVVSGIREAAQQLVDTNPSFEWVAHAHWYPPTMAALGLAVVLLRLVHQPVVTDSPTSASDAAQPPKDEDMNQNITTALNMLPSLIVHAEQIFTSPGSGADKAASVIAAVSPLVPPEKQAQVSSWMSMLVALYNLHGVFAKAPTPILQPSGTIGTAFGQPLSSFTPNPAVAADGSAPA